MKSRLEATGTNEVCTGFGVLADPLPGGWGWCGQYQYETKGLRVAFWGLNNTPDMLERLSPWQSVRA